MFLKYLVFSCLLCAIYADEPGCEPIQTLTTPSVGQKAWNKCLEYQEILYPCEGGSRGNYCKHNDSMEVNSYDAEEDEFPHMAMLGYFDDIPKIVCVGSVISENFILTAASCYDKKSGLPTLAVVGTLKFDLARQDNIYNIKRRIQHPEFKPPLAYNDIALLETDRPIKLSPSVVPACLHTGSQVTEEVIGSGWGTTYTRGPTNEVLQKVKLTSFTEEKCSEHYPIGRQLRNGVLPTQICYGPTEEQRDMCQGNSGSPAQIKSHKCMYTIVALNSRGSRCGVVDHPSIYTRVEKYVPWIESVVWP